MREDSSPQHEGRPSNKERQSIGKYTNLDYFKLDSPRDQIPMVFQDTMKVEPVINQLNREHEEIVAIHKNNPGAKLADLTKKFYDQKEAAEKEAWYKSIKG